MLALKKAISLRLQASVYNCREFQCPSKSENTEDQREMADLPAHGLKFQKVLSEGSLEMMGVSCFVGVRFMWFGVSQ